MKLKKSETAAVALTIFALVLLMGYTLRPGGQEAEFSVKTQREASAEEILTGGDGVHAAEYSEQMKTSDAASSAHAVSAGVETGKKININTASRQELMSLPGIGEVISERIVEYREEHGDFTRLHGLMDVSGIGEKVFAGLEELITIDD